MKITAVTKFKHAEMVDALAKAGWSMAELSRRSGVPYEQLGSYINLRKRPTEKNVKKIEKIFIEEAGIDLDIYATWPESFKGFKKRPEVKSTKDVPMECLISMTDSPLMLPDMMVEHSDDINRMLSNLSDLDDRDKLILDNIFNKNMTLEECSQNVGRTRERVRQLKLSALCKLAYMQDPIYFEKKYAYIHVPRGVPFLIMGRLYKKHKGILKQYFCIEANFDWHISYLPVGVSSYAKVLVIGSDRLEKEQDRIRRINRNTH